LLSGFVGDGEECLARESIENLDEIAARFCLTTAWRALSALVATVAIGRISFDPSIRGPRAMMRGPNKRPSAISVRSSAM